MIFAYKESMNSRNDKSNTEEKGNSKLPTTRELNSAIRIFRNRYLNLNRRSVFDGTKRSQITFAYTHYATHLVPNNSAKGKQTKKKNNFRDGINTTNDTATISDGTRIPEFPHPECIINFLKLTNPGRYSHTQTALFVNVYFAYTLYKKNEMKQYRKI